MRGRVLEWGQRGMGTKQLAGQARSRRAHACTASAASPAQGQARLAGRHALSVVRVLHLPPRRQPQAVGAAEGARHQHAQRGAAGQALLQRQRGPAGRRGGGGAATALWKTKQRGRCPTCCSCAWTGCADAHKTARSNTPGSHTAERSPLACSCRWTGRPRQSRPAGGTLCPPRSSRSRPPPPPGRGSREGRA